MTREQHEAIERRLLASSAAVARLFDDHTPETLTRRPRPEAWSAAECVKHLSLTAAAVVPLVEAALADLEQRGARRAGPSRMDWTGRLIAWSLEPRWLRTKTTARFQPVEPGPVAGVLPEFQGQQERVLRALRAAIGLDLGRARIVSPFDARASYNAWSAFRILEVHERRHLRQAEQAARAASAGSDRP